MFYFACVVISLMTVVHGHSWIACTDYEEMSGLFYSHDKCRAWARSGHQYAPRNQPFGYESGYAYIPTPSTPCKTLRSDVCGYNSEHPMARYYLGQTFVIAHPAKNHANDPRCGQTHNLDNGNWVYAYKTTPDATTDPTRDEFMAPDNLIADLGISPVTGRPGYTAADFTTYPKVGFQNAPAYCQGTDGALATNNVTVPTHWTPGRYSFMWVWFMGCPSVTCSYTSCWEADIYATKAEADAAKIAAAQPAHQDVTLRFNSNWGSGADGSIDMPPDFNTSLVHVKFPVNINSFSVWGAVTYQTQEMRENNEYYLYQRGTWWQPAQAGFTISFSQESYLMPCGIAATEIETHVVTYDEVDPTLGQPQIRQARRGLERYFPKHHHSHFNRWF